MHFFLTGLHPACSGLILPAGTSEYILDSLLKFHLHPGHPLELLCRVALPAQTLCIAQKCLMIEKVLPGGNKVFQNHVLDQWPQAVFDD